ncbi:hypothetical protein PanWU01x14_160200 [Parasponia andersonii]|uniref:Uncharacterized protein n=1 Tax=Parasponia andersonii TaxID=3476 RepID=A0A2P5CE27_PARAD|nr:hypothetical protein PanWU01x14_160200 [Parasponia andersonii]
MRPCLRILPTLVVFHGHNIEYHLLDSTKTRLERREQTSGYESEKILSECKNEKVFTNVCYADSSKSAISS